MTAPNGYHDSVATRKVDKKFGPCTEYELLEWGVRITVYDNTKYVIKYEEKA